MKKIIAFAGSNHSHSLNYQLIQHASTLVERHSVEILDLRAFHVPIYSIDLEQRQGIPEQIRQMKNKLRQADAFIIASPEHNGSIPAFFKNIIDWLSRIEQNIFGGKPVLLLSASPGAKGGKTNLEHLSKLMPFWGAEVTGTYSIGNFDARLKDGRGRLSMSEHRQLETAIRTLENRLNADAPSVAA